MIAAESLLVVLNELFKLETWLPERSLFAGMAGRSSISSAVSKTTLLFHSSSFPDKSKSFFSMSMSLVSFDIVRKKKIFEKTGRLGRSSLGDYLRFGIKGDFDL